MHPITSLTVLFYFRYEIKNMNNTPPGEATPSTTAFVPNASSTSVSVSSNTYNTDTILIATVVCMSIVILIIGSLIIIKKYKNKQETSNFNLTIENDNKSVALIPANELSFIK